MAESQNVHRPDRHNLSSVLRSAAILGVLGLLLPLVTATSASAAPEILLGRNKIGEFQGVRGDNFLAWQQNTKKHPLHYDVFARPITGGSAFKVNARGTNGANGGIDGDLLVYQQFRRHRSDLKFFDLSTRNRMPPPAGVNTRRWEYWPSMSGQWLLFGRLAHNGSRTIILYDLSTNVRRKLDRVRRDDAFLAPGQVNGNYAVWYRCTAAGKCNVKLYDIATGVKTRIPNPGGSQYAPSVSPDGTVIFVRSARGCGRRVRLVNYPLGGSATVVWRVPSGADVGTTRIYVGPQGETTLYYDNYGCGRPADSDVWQFVEPGATELTVQVVGSGSVTSSPAGINCGSDCSETYEPGTGVTLTANPDPGSTFAGWGGACTGTNTTCTLTMNVARSVTATFTDKPVLTVTKGGTGGGTVTSSPGGINCGMDCVEPYAPGTVVALTATPNGTSTFAGWTGACGGMLGCMVTMDTSKSVTATFAAVNQTLTVTVVGSGTVTSDVGGISCPGTCSADFPPNTVVTLTGMADPGSAFTGWSGAGCTGTSPCSITMDGPKMVTATFNP